MKFLWFVLIYLFAQIAFGQVTPPYSGLTSRTHLTYNLASINMLRYHGYYTTIDIESNASGKLRV
jgi:hypothetical protein